MTRIVLIDGRSGSGKTTLAARLAATLGADTVHMDDLYPGWHGLEAGARTAATDIVRALADGRAARWRRWDWYANAYAEAHVREPGGVLIIEGCGSLSREAARFASVRIWMEVDAHTRYERARRRDGDDSWWEGWSRQEDAFYTREASSTLANLKLYPQPSSCTRSSSMP